MLRLAALAFAILIVSAPWAGAQEAPLRARDHASLQVDQVLAPALALAALIGALFSAFRRWCSPPVIDRDEEGSGPVLQTVKPPPLRLVSRRRDLNEPPRRRP
jgi:hypothetical protein